MEIENNPILQRITQFLCDTIKQEMLHAGFEHKGHYASGETYDSVCAAVERNLFGVSIDIEAAEQAKYLLSGREKGKKGVPLDALIEWVRQKKFDLKGNRERSVAFLIQRSIREKGIQPSKFMVKATRRFDKSKRLESNIEKFMEQYLDDLLQTMLKQLNT